MHINSFLKVFERSWNYLGEPVNQNIHFKKLLERSQNWEKDDYGYRLEKGNLIDRSKLIISPRQQIHQKHWISQQQTKCQRSIQPIGQIYLGLRNLNLQKDHSRA